MKTSVITLTVELAEEFLAANTHNRPLSEKRAQDYARQIELGLWRLNGEAIKRAKDGTLLDGQTRCRAVQIAGRSIPVLLVEDLEIEDQDSMDGGRPRTTANSLSIDGITNATTVAGIARRKWQWTAGNLKFANTQTASVQELKAFVRDNPSVHRSAEMGRQIANGFRPASAVISGTAHSILTDVNQDDAALFFARLASGVITDEGDPVLALRERMIQDKLTRKAVPFHLAVALHFRAWNGMREGRTMARLVHTADEPMVRPV